MKTLSGLKNGIEGQVSPLLGEIDQAMEECLETYVKLNRIRNSLLLSQGIVEHKNIPEDVRPFLSVALKRKLSGVVGSYIKLKKLQRAFVCAELAALCVFIVGSLTIFVALLHPNLLMSSTLDRVVEIAFLCGTAVFFATFLLRRLLLPRIRAGIVDRIDCCEEILDPNKEKLDKAICKVREDCKPSHPTKAERVATCLRFFTLLGGLVLELLLVIDLFHDFGLKKAHGDFFFTLDDMLELLFTAVGLLCSSLSLYSHYSKQQNKGASKADCALAAKAPFLQRGPNALWVFLGTGFLSLGNRIFRGLEGTGCVKISIPGGVVRVGLLFAVLLCLLDIYLTCGTQEELITSDLADVNVSARVVPVITDIVP
ncbi:hypothetical protein ACJZTR_00845 [Neorickettsia risticii]